MRSDPLVSVLVPSYNHARQVEEALRSVVAQTYRTIELIVIDDCSKDGTYDTAARLCADPAFRDRFADRVHVERNPRNLGAHATLNRGISMSRGEFVAILNSDDVYAPDRIRITLTELTHANRQIAFTGVQMIDAEGRDVTVRDTYSASLREAQRRIPEYPSVGFAVLERNVAISTGNLVFTRSLFDRVGEFRPLAYCHDWDFLLRCVLETEPLYVPELLYAYRMHPTNSFRSLGGVRDREASAVLRSYFSAARRGRFSNPAAPAPNTWPGVFEDALAAFRLEQAWTRTRVSPAS